MRYAAIILFGGLILSTSWLGRGVLTRHEAVAAPAPAAIEWGWRTLGTWSGGQSLITESFTTDTGVFRISWKAARAGQSTTSPLLSVVINSAVSGRPLIYPVNVQAPGEDVVYVRDDPRIFYAQIDAAGFDWTVTIEDGVAGTSNGGAQPSPTGVDSGPNTRQFFLVHMADVARMTAAF